MRKFVLVCLVFCSISLPICALSQVTMSKYDSLLQSLLENVKNNDSSLGDADAAAKRFKELRFAYAETPQYNPYGGIKTEIDGAMRTAFSNKEYKKALESAEKILKEDHVDIDAHMVASAVYRETGNQKKADYHRAIVGLLIESMLSDGRGDKPETAIEVISTDEEYALLNISGLRVSSQATLQVNAHNYDKMIVKDSVSGKTFEIFFCIDRPFQWLQNSLKKGN
jgi:tetratricopeptide (TPR) repeat protein